MRYTVAETRLELWRYYYEIDAATPDEARELAKQGIKPNGEYVMHDNNPVRLQTITGFYEVKETTC